ncbi:MAG: hypothetical protein V1914_04780 [archaeon]
MKKTWELLKLCINCPNNDLGDILDIKITPFMIYSKIKEGRCPFSCSIVEKEDMEKMKKCAEWICSELGD